MSFKNNIKKTRVQLTKAIAIFAFLTEGLTASAQTHSSEKLHFGLVYPISSNGTHAPLDTNNLSVNLIAGISASEKGLSFAGFSNVVRNGAKGIQFAGFSNHIGKMAEGAQFAGFMNTYGESNGVSFAGFTNIASGNVKGAQFAGFSNIAKHVSGAQFAGFLNKSANLTGSQFAGFINIAGKKVGASQFAGFINIAENVKGSQFAGFINIAKKVKGSQIAGFINIADSSDYPIGIINIVKNGEMSIGVSTDENLTTMATFRSGGKVLYGIIGIGYNFENTDEVYAAEAGLGAHFFNAKTFSLNTELTSSMLESFKKGEYFKATLRVLPTLKITPFLSLSAGPSLNYVSTDTAEGRALTKKYITSKENKRGTNFYGLYAGYNAGIQVIF
ncbi:hypothetical protein [Pedobacter metabolipauper]|uniref:Uncharacterized protein n=1 Tax=Pedobacter metabolipauper TaxID=425513 RepID=A0A4R6T0Z2_9SPHI|nr:hypothetical protein [Pedobacter metabolipauper]TDQ12055.1 hypothetical protein ATK78_1186 [Pedobacter metabolipauper]